MNCSSDGWAGSIIGRAMAVWAHSCPMAGDPALTQAITSGTQPAHEGHEPWSPLCLFPSFVMAKSWILILVGEGEEQLLVVRLSPAPLHGSAAESSLQIIGRGIHQGGELTKILCSPAHWQQTLYSPLSWGRCRESRFVWKEGLTGLV